MSCNFFQAIGLANIEMVHSAIISWMLSDGCDAFEIESKSKLLCLLFGEDPNRVFVKIVVKVEVYNLDILIETKDEKSKITYWVVENKIKSSQRKNQLDDYSKILENLAPEYEKKFCLLSLINEKPRCKKEKWHCTTYGQLADYIGTALNHAKEGTKEYMIVHEYLDCIKTLDSALKVFLKDPQAYPNVFTDGSKRKECKILGEDSFIGNNNLETIFQKCYLERILQNLDIELCKEYVIKETRGIAMIDYLSYQKLSCGLESHIQIQDGTFKVFLCMIDDEKADKKTFLNSWREFFVMLNKEHIEWHINPPKSKPSISISKPDKEWFKRPQQELIGYWRTMYDECKSIQEAIIKEVQGRCRKSFKE